MTSSQICTLIDECINGADAERNRAIMKRRYVDGIRYEPLAEEFGLSVRQCKRIVKNCLLKIHAEIN